MFYNHFKSRFLNKISKNKFRRTFQRRFTSFQRNKKIYLLGLVGIPTLSYLFFNYATAITEDNKESFNVGPQIFKIVITGGPCAGKSTALASISDRLLSLGFRVFRIPEAATLVITGTGIFPPNLTEYERLVFEGSLIKTKIALEDIFLSIAKSSNQKCVILCDRGTMDTSAYIDKERWEILLDEYNWNIVDLRDRRYDAVIHMVTAAIGAERSYTTENNAARIETLEEARAVDFKLLNAWVGHPRIKIIDNSTDFKRKIQRVEEAVCQIVGAPRPAKSNRKFILSDEAAVEILDKMDIKYDIFEVEQTYLQSNEEEGYNYLRRRGQNGMYTYTHSYFKKDDGSDELIILERLISGRDYVGLLKQADLDRDIIRKKVVCFLWDNIYYQVTTYVQPDIKLVILNLETENPDKEIDFPFFINVKGEVSNIAQFTSYYISQKFKRGVNNTLQLSWKQNQEMTEVYEKIKKDSEEKRAKKKEEILGQVEKNKK